MQHPPLHCHIPPSIYRGVEVPLKGRPRPHSRSDRAFSMARVFDQRTAQATSESDVHIAAFVSCGTNCVVPMTGVVIRAPSTWLHALLRSGRLDSTPFAAAMGCAVIARGCGGLAIWRWARMKRLTLIRLRELVAMTGISRSSVYLKIGKSKYADPSFPRPISLSPTGRGAVAWIESEVQDWIIKQRDMSRCE